MKCTLCRADSPDDQLGNRCRVCLEKQSRAELLRRQSELIGEVVHGKLQLKAARRLRSGPYHLQLFGDAYQAYCGESLAPPIHRHSLIYREAVRPGICPTCLVVFDQVWTEASIREAKAQ